MTSWAAALSIYVAIGMLCWNILWIRHLRHSPGAMGLMQDLPGWARIVRVMAECVFWPALVCFGLWKAAYERKLR